jgi:hypothetical protein
LKPDIAGTVRVIVSVVAANARDDIIAFVGQCGREGCF